jgi:hypothetical protein
VEVHEGGEQREERHEGGDAVVLRIEALDGVLDKGIVRDRCANIGERIASGLLLEAVGCDVLVALDDVAKFLAEVACWLSWKRAVMLARVEKAEWEFVITMSVMSGAMEPYNQCMMVASRRSQSSSSTGGTAMMRWSKRAYWVTATWRKFRHLVKLEALRSRVTGMRYLMLWMAVA